MIEAVEAQRIALSALSAGAVVIFGAMYAIFLALGNLNDNAILRLVGNCAYLLLAVSVCFLAYFLQLYNWWLVLVATLLVGYFAAPRMIWRICVEVHQEDNQTLEVLPK